MMGELKRSARRSPFHIGTVVVALAFMTTGGLTCVEHHPVAQASAEAMHPMVPQAGSTHHEPGSEDTHHGDHGHPEQCTCVGPCQSAAAPSPPDAVRADVSADEIDHVKIVDVANPLIRQSATAYLRPLPNAPPVLG
jgi:hypothetical protein